MIIRKANREDADTIAVYLLMAMETIVFEFIGKNDPEAAQELLLNFVKQKDNQYSYQNCWVVEDNQQILAAVNVYDGADLERLRAPIVHYIETYFNQSFRPEDETAAGEFYIDTLAVHPKQRGKGIGAKLLQFMIQYYVHQNKQTLGLLVDIDNPNAKRLYLRLGFKSIGNKTLMGKNMHHLQIWPDQT